MGQRNQYWGTNERYRDASRQLSRGEEAAYNIGAQQKQRPHHGSGDKLCPLFIYPAQPDNMRDD